MARVIRPMRHDDLETVLALQRETALASVTHVFPQDEYPYPAEPIRRRWEREYATPTIDCFVVAPTDLAVVGYAVTHRDELLHFATAVHLWGSGLAHEAHEDVLDHLRGQGHEVAHLRVLAENHRARRFYERRGWSPTGESVAEPFPPHPVLLTYARCLAPGGSGG